MVLEVGQRVEGENDGGEDDATHRDDTNHFGSQGRTGILKQVPQLFLHISYGTRRKSFLVLFFIVGFPHSREKVKSLFFRRSSLTSD